MDDEDLGQGMLDVRMSLPNESLPIVLQFADYKTLVFTKLAGRRFLQLARKYAQELARHRRFRVTFRTTYISYSDVEVGQRPKRIRYEPVSQPSFAAACLELDGAIGPHAVATLIFTGSTMIMEGVGGVFEAAPALKYAADVDLHWPSDSTSGSNNPNVFLLNFEAMKTLRLSLGYNSNIFRQLNWTFVHKESARELRLIKVSGCGPVRIGSMNDSDKELVRYCVTLSHLQGGQPLELDFSASYFSGALGLQIIEVLKGGARELTFRMSAQFYDGELIRHAVGAHTGYSMVNDRITRCASDASGIAVEVKSFLRQESRDPCSVVIQRTAEVPRKKPRTSEEVVPLMPFVEYRP